jgi:hypothetical protein
MIADRMSKTGVSSRRAAAALLAEAGSVECAGRALLPPGWTAGYAWGGGQKKTNV